MKVADLPRKTKMMKNEESKCLVHLADNIDEFLELPEDEKTSTLTDEVAETQKELGKHISIEEVHNIFKTVRNKYKLKEQLNRLGTE